MLWTGCRTDATALAKAGYARFRGSPLARSVPRAAVERINAVAVLLVAVDVGAVLVASRLAGPAPGYAWAPAALLLGTRAAAGLYRKRLWLSWLHDLPRSVSATAIALGLSTAIALWMGHPDRPDAAVTVTGAVVLAFAAVSEPARFAVFALGRWARRRFGRCDRSIVVGAGEVGVDLVRTMLDHPEFGLKPVGFVDAEPGRDRARLPVDVLEGDLPSLITRLRVGTVVLTCPPSRDAPVVDAAITAHQRGCTTLVVPQLFELCQDGPDIERLRCYPLMRLSTAPIGRPSWWVKRTLDCLLAAVALAALAPVIALCALGTYLESGRPVFFRQVRVGMDGRAFVLFKLRSVRPGAEDDSQTRWSVAGDPRVGPVGGFLRRTSLDELPQLWNVIRGDMSIVGPRPERPGFVREFSATHELYWARHRVPTGLTGLAQVHGLRGDTSIADRCRYDNYYIANWSLWLDVKIMLLTVGELLRRKKR